MEKLLYSFAGSGKPALLARLVPGVKIAPEPPGVMYPDDGGILVTATFENPWRGAGISVRGLKLQHVTMGEMPAMAPPEKLKALPGADWLDPAGFSLEPGGKIRGRLCFQTKPIPVSMPCALEATPSLGGVGRGGVKCVPIKDLEEAAKKAAAKKV